MHVFIGCENDGCILFAMDFIIHKQRHFMNSNTISKSQYAIADKIRPFPIISLLEMSWFFPTYCLLQFVCLLCVLSWILYFDFSRKPYRLPFQWTIHSDKINGQIKLTIASQMVSRIVRCSYKEQKNNRAAFIFCLSKCWPPQSFPLYCDKNIL